MPDLHQQLASLRNDTPTGPVVSRAGGSLNKVFWRAHNNKQLLLIDRALDLNDDRARQQYLRQIANKGKSHD